MILSPAMLARLQNLDRRVIYVLVLIALSLPLIAKYALKPARMHSAEKLFDVVEALPTGAGSVAIVSLDFGPSTIAENGSQAQVILEHLMRRRVRFMLVSQSAEAGPMLKLIPEQVAARLSKEIPGEKWLYGKDWVNLGYLAGGYITIQSIPKAENLLEFFKKDVRGNSLTDLEVVKGITSFEQVSFLMQVTSLVGTLENYLQFFQTDKHRPIFGHGCTSIAIPQAFIYLDSGQISGLFEGIAGAAWYSELLKRKFPLRAVDDSALINTGLGVAHLVIIALVIMGNIVAFSSRRQPA
jgi:hypothetical protein